MAQKPLRHKKIEAATSPEGTTQIDTIIYWLESTGALHHSIWVGDSAGDSLKFADSRFTKEWGIVAPTTGQASPHFYIANEALKIRKVRLVVEGTAGSFISVDVNKEDAPNGTVTLISQAVDYENGVYDLEVLDEDLYLDELLSFNVVAVDVGEITKVMVQVQLSYTPQIL